MKRIEITREGDTVKFENVTVVNTDTVFFVNLDPVEAHWPEISADQVGPFPSLPSSECQLPKNGTYRCQIPEHTEVGTITIVEPLAPVNTDLQQATNGQQITDQQVVSGGKSPYQISGQLFEVNDSDGTTIQSGSGIGPGLHLIPTMNDNGISVGGTPTLSGTYHFTFMVDDAIGGNLQQVQYSMKVV